MIAATAKPKVDSTQYKIFKSVLIILISIREKNSVTSFKMPALNHIAQNSITNSEEAG